MIKIFFDYTNLFKFLIVSVLYLFGFSIIFIKLSNDNYIYRQRKKIYFLLGLIYLEVIVLLN